MTQQWIFGHQAQEYAVVIAIKFKEPHGWPDCVDRFIQGITQSDTIHIVPVRAIVAPAHLARENAASDRINSVWLVNNPVDLDTY